MINFGALDRLADLSPAEFLRGLVHGSLSAAPRGPVRRPLPDHGALETVAEIETFLWTLVCPPGDPRFIDYLQWWFAKAGEARAAADPNAAQSGGDAAFAVPPKFPNLAELAADLNKIRQSDLGFAEALIDGRLEDAAGCCGSAPDAGKVQTLGKMMLVHSLFELQAIGDELHQSIWQPNSLLVTKSIKPHTGDTVSSLFLNGLNLVDDVRTAFYSGKQFTPSDRGSAVSRIGRSGRSSGLMDSDIFKKFVALFPQDAQKKGLPAHDKRMRLLSLAVRRADKFLQPIEARMRTAAEQRVLVPEWARPVGSASADRAMYSRATQPPHTPCLLLPSWLTPFCNL